MPPLAGARGGTGMAWIRHTRYNEGGWRAGESLPRHIFILLVVPSYHVPISVWVLSPKHDARRATSTFAAPRIGTGIPTVLCVERCFSFLRECSLSFSPQVSLLRLSGRAHILI